MRASVHRYTMRDPGDVSELAGAIAAGQVRAEHIVAVLGKTEGNGLVNDFTRGYLTQSLKLLLAEKFATSVADAVAEKVFVFPAAPRACWQRRTTWCLRRSRRASSPAAKRPSPSAPPSRRCSNRKRSAAWLMCSALPRRCAAIGEARIADPADVHFVQIEALRHHRARRRGEGARRATGDFGPEQVDGLHPCRRRVRRGYGTGRTGAGANSGRCVLHPA